MKKINPSIKVGASLSIISLISVSINTLMGLLITSGREEIFFLNYYLHQYITTLPIKLITLISETASDPLLSTYSTAYVDPSLLGAIFLIISWFIIGVLIPVIYKRLKAL